MFTIHCDPFDLKNALALVSRAVSTRSVLPILSNVALVAQKEHEMLILKATNLEIYLEAELPATIEEAGEITVSAKHLADVLSPYKKRKANDAPISITIQEKSLLITSPKFGTTLLATMPYDEYPSRPEFHAEVVPLHQHITCEGRLLKEIIGLTTYAASEDESRPVFTGVCLHRDLERQVIEYITADAFRLALYRAPYLLPKGREKEEIQDVLIPAATMTTLAKLIESREAIELFLVPERALVVFRSSRWTLCSRTIEGVFPNYQYIVPKEYHLTCRVLTEDLLTACQYLRRAAEDTSNILTMCFEKTAENEVDITLRAGGNDTMEKSMKLASSECGGESLTVHFNVCYLLDIAQVIQKTGAREIVLNLNDKKPSFLHPFGQSAQQMHLIMPMHVNDRYDSAPVRKLEEKTDVVVAAA